MQKCAKTMQKLCTNMHKYARPRNIEKHAKYVQKMCKNMQTYAKYAIEDFICRICTPHFADAGPWPAVAPNRLGRHHAAGPVTHDP